MNEYLHGKGGVYSQRITRALDIIHWLYLHNVSLLTLRRPGSPAELVDPEDQLDELLDGMQSNEQQDNTRFDSDLEALLTLSDDEAPDDDRTTPVATSPLTLSDDTESQEDEAEPQRG